MLKRFQSRFLVDLGEMEGDYRVFHLKDDISQSTLYISIAMLGVLSMTLRDILLYQKNPDLFMTLLVYQGGYIFVSLLIITAIRKTTKVRIYDRLMLAWLSLTILCLLLFNFTRPTNILNTIYDVIILFAIYILSPLKIPYTMGLAF